MHLKGEDEKSLTDYRIDLKKFLMERYLYIYPFSKIKKINSFQQMKRDYYHYFIKKDKVYSEKKVLNDYFLNR